MIFTNKNLSTIYLLVILFTITISFIVNRKQIKSLILMPFEKKKSYLSLYFQRNTNFSFIRFNFTLITILISTCFIAFFFKKIFEINFSLLLILVICFYFLKHILTILWGFMTNKYLKYKKISIIVIDANTLISMYFLPILFISHFNDFFNISIVFIISIIFFLTLIISELILIIKAKSLIDLKIKDIILYICAFEIVPVITFYIALK
tara:strand:+ start:1145 stop:1768 length:624 start_codon:yes stop_codon:yes gene_type:complete